MEPVGAARVLPAAGARVKLPAPLVRHWQDLQLNFDAITKALSIENVRYVGTAGQPAFQNAWVNFDAGSPPPVGTARNAGFWKDGAGMVHLTGIVKTGASLAVIFTLPAGYLPASSHSFTVLASGGPAEIDIAIAGTVLPFNLIAGTNVSAFCCLDGISFRAGT